MYWVKGALVDVLGHSCFLPGMPGPTAICCLPPGPLLQRALSRVAFKKVLADHQGVRLDIARSRIELDAARWVGGRWVAQSESCRSLGWQLLDWSVAAAV